MDKREIASLFGTHGVKISEADVWAVQGTPVIKHSALERLSAALKITWDAPVIVRAERDECVVLARATRQDGIVEWSFGEALIVKDSAVGGNYKVSGRQAAYPYAMAEKRAKDRVIIKLAGLHGAYSEEEADDFKAGNRDQGEAQPASGPQARQEPAQTDQKGVAEWRKEIAACASAADLEALKRTNEFKKDWASWNEPTQHAVKRMFAVAIAAFASREAA